MKDSNILKEKLEGIPSKPGVYMFKDDKDELLYVGKAANLKSRVRSYVTESSNDRGERIKNLREKIRDVECIVTANEIEALTLENNLIKEHGPPYNVLLRDDKTYPYIKITTGEEYPRAEITRRVYDDSHKYFGPIIPAGKAGKLLEVLHQHFALRQCRGDLDDKEPSGCLYYQLGQCVAPCSHSDISKEEYLETVSDAIDFLDGKRNELLEDLKERMYKASDEKRFEKAAYYRDLIDAVESIKPNIQRVSITEKKDIDVVGISRDCGSITFQILTMKEGKIGDQHRFAVETSGENELSVLSSVLRQYYSSKSDIPGLIILPKEPEDKDILLEWLEKKRGKKVEIRTPKRGKKKKLLELAQKNASLRASEDMKSNVPEELNLEGVPKRVDAFDVSTFAGTDAVASMVVWKDGIFKKEEYRRFKIKRDFIDDSHCISEVVERRYKRVKREELEYPELILVDGGKPQVGAAFKVLSDLDLEYIPLAGLAKKEELLYLPDRKAPLRLPGSNFFLKILQAVRDEAHRFAVDYHRKKRKDRTLSTELTDIRGIGKVKAGKLLEEFGSVERIKEAPGGALEEVVGKKLTDRIKNEL